MMCTEKASSAIQMILNADDLGGSKAINTAVRQAHRQGMLTSASLMVTGDAWEDEFWENLYTWAIMGAHNAATLRRLRRGEIWMTTGEFLSRYGEANLVCDDSAQDQWGGG